MNGTESTKQGGFSLQLHWFYLYLIVVGLVCASSVWCSVDKDNYDKVGYVFAKIDLCLHNIVFDVSSVYSQCSCSNFLLINVSFAVFYLFITESIYTFITKMSFLWVT